MKEQIYKYNGDEVEDEYYSFCLVKEDGFLYFGNGLPYPVTAGKPDLRKYVITDLTYEEALLITKL